MRVSIAPRFLPATSLASVPLSPFLGVVGFALMLFETSRYGLGVSPDSTEYLFAGQAFAHGHGLIYKSGGAWVWWPPLYPVILGIASRPFGHVLEAARLVNALCLGGLVAMCGFWLERHCRSRLVALIGTAAILLLVPVWDVMVFAWSEVPFILLATASLLVLGSACARPSLRLVGLAGVLAAMAWLTRYVGVSVAFTGCAALFFWPSSPLKQRFQSAALFGAIAGIPNILWLIHYAQVAHTILGFRAPASLTLSQALEPIPRVIASWVVPDSLPGSTTLGWIVLTAAAASCCGILAGHVHERVMREVMPYLFPLLLFVPIFLFWLVASDLRYFVGVLDTRLLSPVAVPAALVAAVTLDRLQAIFDRRALPVVALAAAWLFVPVAHLKERSDSYLAQGVTTENRGYRTTQFITSPTLSFVRHLPSSTEIYARDPSAVYAVTDRTSKQSPTHYAAYGSTDWSSVQVFKSLARGRRPIVLAWTRCCVRPVIGPRVLRRWVVLRPLTVTRDGTVYAVSAPRRQGRK